MTFSKNLILACLIGIMGQAFCLAQEPVPDVTPTPAPPQEVVFFQGETDLDKAIVGKAHELLLAASSAELREMGFKGIRPKKRLRRLLKKDRFNAELAETLKDDFRFSPEGEVVGEIGDGTLLQIILDWIDSGGLERLINLIIDLLG